MTQMNWGNWNGTSTSTLHDDGRVRGCVGPPGTVKRPHPRSSIVVVVAVPSYTCSSLLGHFLLSANSPVFHESRRRMILWRAAISSLKLRRGLHFMITFPNHLRRSSSYWHSQIASSLSKSKIQDTNISYCGVKYNQQAYSIKHVKLQM